MPLPFLLGDKRPGARMDEEVTTPKEESLQVDVPSPNQASAVYPTQYPSQWAKIRLRIFPSIAIDPMLTRIPERLSGSLRRRCLVP